MQLCGPGVVRFGCEMRTFRVINGWAVSERDIPPLADVAPDFAIFLGALRPGQASFIELGNGGTHVHCPFHFGAFS